MYACMHVLQTRFREFAPRITESVYLREDGSITAKGGTGGIIRGLLLVTDLTAITDAHLINQRMSEIGAG